MTARQRPGPELAEDEILSAILGDAVDGLESLQATGPVPGIEDIAGAIRFVRYRIIKRIPAEIDHGQGGDDGTEMGE